MTAAGRRRGRGWTGRILALALGLLAALPLLAPGPARAQVLPDSLPFAARQTATSLRAPDSYAFPIGPATAQAAPPVQLVEGTITRRAWVTPGGDVTSLQLLRPLRAALEAEGFETLLNCAAQRCGGFDFRFALEVIDPPAMMIDLFDYRALTARRGGTAEAPAQMVFVLVSRSSSAGYIQVVEADSTPGAAPTDPVDPAPTKGLAALPAAPLGEAQADSFASALERDGRLVLSDLRFATGAVRLEGGPAASLDALAQVLAAHPEARLLLVGHTDSEGSLDTNRTLSRQRAEAVRQRLIQAHDIAPGRIEAHGVGFLAPIASNTTEAGRKANRRVEAILLP
ncbi:OmpA family protein [Pseudooceanicola sp. 200-1SW]|uniref:OmpA family protein n=1 Tax=Pseudooceanicola sp. 200-1SW TaxID=3425949 RepID=UPI003D7F2126